MTISQDPARLSEMAGKAREAGTQALQSAKDAGTQALETADELASAPIKVAEDTPAKLYLAAVGGSIAASLMLFLAGRKQASLFVGLWAPTILNLALVSKLLRPSHESLAAAGEEPAQPRRNRGRRR
jgi:hypothetical protein